MRKKLAVVMAAMLTLCMTVPAFAAESDSATSVQEISSNDNDDGTTDEVVESALGTTVTVTASTAGTTESVGGVQVPTSAEVATGTGLVLSFTDASGKKAENVSLNINAASKDVISTVTTSISVGGVNVSVQAKDIVAAIDITASGFSSGSATVPLKVDNVKKGEAVYGIHIKNGVAEIIPVVAVENGIVLITTTSFSPIIIVKGTAPAAVQKAAADTASAGSSDGAATSPKTADTIPAAAVIALICLMGAAVCFRKSAPAR